MARIFISYKRNDKDKVFPIKDQIEASTGERCWIDIDGIESDAQFVDIIMKAIDDASIILFMYSQSHSIIQDYKMDWTIREISYAQEEGKRLVFVNVDRTPLTRWFKFMFPQQQQVDATSPEAMKRLLSDINKWLGIQPKPIVTPEPVVAPEPKPAPIVEAKPEVAPQGKFCRRCGILMSPGANFCRKCGKVLF